MKAHLSLMNWRKRSALAALVAFLVLAAGPTANVRADLSLDIESVNASAGAFDVFLTNSGPSAVHIDTTQFEITSSSAQVNLTSATIYTTVAPYIFAGNSLFGPTISTMTGQTLDASDVYGGAGDVSVAANSTVGLGHILFSVTGTLSSSVTISFNMNANDTSLADMGANVPISTFVNGTITPGILAVPEPASIVQVATAVVLGGIVLWRRRIRLA